MSVNGITGSVATAAASSQVYTYQPETKAKTDSSADEVASTAQVSKNDTSASTGVVYSHSTDVEAAKAARENTKTYKQDPQLVSKLKADAEERAKQLTDIVNQLLSDQGKTFDIANGKNLKSVFENLKVDPATREQAQKDIAEDGYWGVKQTSERIFDFAKALSGGDPDENKRSDLFQQSGEDVRYGLAGHSGDLHREADGGQRGARIPCAQTL